MLCNKVGMAGFLGLLFLIGACGQAKQNQGGNPPEPAPSAIGNWEDDAEYRNPGALAKQRFEITQDSFSRIVRCTFTTGSVEVKLTSPSKLDFRTIEILEGKAKSSTFDRQRCSNSLNQQIAFYSVTATTMEIQLDGVTLKLRRQ